MARAEPAGPPQGRMRTGGSAAGEASESPDPSPPGRPKGEHRSAQHEGSPVSSLPDPRFGYDVAVLGAGPAGAAAAVEAAALGLRAAIIDAHMVAGGHAYRAVPGIAPVRSDQERTDGDKLRAALGAANVVRYFAHRVRQHRARRVAVAFAGDRRRRAADDPRSEAHRRHRCAGAPPAVRRLGTARRHGTCGGHRHAQGPARAAGPQRRRRRRRDRCCCWWPRRSSTAAARGGDRRRASAQRLVRERHRIAVAAGSRDPRHELVSRAPCARRADAQRVHAPRGDGRRPRLHATAVPVDRDGRVRTDAPVVDCRLRRGLLRLRTDAATDVTRMLGASHAFDPALGGWHVVVDDDQRCNVAGLYAAGDGAGVVGAAAAPWQGRIAAMAAARDAGRLSGRRARSARARREARVRARRALRRRDDAARQRRRRRRRHRSRRTSWSASAST